MLQMQSRVEYDAYVPAGNPSEKPTELQKREWIAAQRAYHLCGLMFLLSVCDLSNTPEGKCEISVSLREIGSLGLAIAGGIFADIESFVKLANNTGSGLEGE